MSPRDSNLAVGGEIMETSGMITRRKPASSRPGPAIAFLSVIHFGLLVTGWHLAIGPTVAGDAVAANQPAIPRVFPGTQPLEAGPNLMGEWRRFLEDEIRRAAEGRGHRWQHDTSSAEAYARSVEPMRRKLGELLGIPSPPFELHPPESIVPFGADLILGEGPGYTIHAVRWKVVQDLWGEGLLLVPSHPISGAQVIAIPDAAQTPEQLAGLDPGVAAESQYARKLVRAGVRVLIPRIVDRAVRRRGEESWREYSQQRINNREFLYRPGFQLGRHLIGMEVRKIRAAARWLQGGALGRVGLVGWGEGGLLALYSAALDPVFSAALVSGYFQGDRTLWREPLDRNVYDLMTWFGDAEIASLIVPRAFFIETAPGPEGRIESPGGAAGLLVRPVALA